MSAPTVSVEASTIFTAGGEMGRLMRAHDWYTSPLGPPETWPQSLRSVVQLMLSNRQLMFVAWGSELAFLYNDGYAPTFGKKHPWALGRPFHEVWSEIWTDIEPLVTAALAGETTYSENLHLVMERNGYPEDAWFTFSYSPLRDESGAIAGMFCAGIETTGQVLAERRIVAERDRQRKLFEQAPGFITILSGPELRFEFVNDAYDRLFGRRGFVGKTVREVFPDLEGQPFFDLLDNAYATGERFVARTIPIRLQATLEAEPADHFLDFIYEPVRDEAGAVTGLFIEGHDVTERVRAEQALTEAERRLSAAVDAAGLSADFRALFEASPTPFLVVAPPDWTIVAANDARIKVAGVSREAQIGRKLFDLFPDDPDDPTADGVKNLTASFERVIATGTGDAMAVQRYAVQGPDGHFVERWWSPVNSPVLDRNGAVTLIIHRVEDVTETVQLRGEAEARDQLARDQQAVIDRLHASEAALRESEARQAFLLELSDALRSLHTPTEIASAAAERLGERFGLNRVFYAEYLGSVMRVERDFTRGVDSIVGEHDLAAFGPDLLRAYHECAIVKVDDVATDARFSEEARVGLRARQVGAYLDVVLFEDEQWVSLLAFQSATPRKWTATEENLSREIGERVKSAIERARAEERLRELNADLERKVTERALARGRTWTVSPEIMGVINAAGYFEQSNPAWASMLGWSEDEVARTVFFDFIHPDDLAKTQAAWTDAIERGLPALRFENRYRHRDGGWRWLSWVAVPDDGKVYCSARDITAEKEQAAALGERTAERDRMWESSPDLMLVIDFDGVFRRVNPAWTTVLGYAPEELVGRHVNEFVLSDDHGETTDAYELAAAGGLPVIVNRYRHKDGSIRWISWTAAPAGDMTYATGRDITLNKEREAELKSAQEALRQSQKMEAMGSLTGGVAHDFNNLLTPIIGSLDMLVRKGVGSERERRLIDGALQSAERAKTLVQRLLAFARRQPLQPVAVDIGRLVEGMAGLIGSTLGPTIDVHIDLAPDLPPAQADLNQLEMALLNLAVNARDAMPEGGELTISAKRESVRGVHKAGVKPGHYVRLCVTDSGVGMDQATIARAVEPFFSTKGIGKGTGLGLSMVHGLASQLGGGLTIESEPGRGTSIELWLPISGTVVGEDDGAATTPSARVGRGRALLVDDEELVRMSTADMLIDLGFEVIEAGCAEEALGLMNAGAVPDLLVTDHLMPGMTGAELAQRARALKPDLSVLVVSGYAEVEGIAPGLPRLTKPFRSAELAASLAALIPAIND